MAPSVPNVVTEIICLAGYGLVFRLGVGLDMGLWFVLGLNIFF